MTTSIIPQVTDKSDYNLDLDTCFVPELEPSPQPMPSDSTLANMALWYHQVGYRVIEDKPRSKHQAKHYQTDDGQRRSAVGIRQAWHNTPDANVSIRLGWQWEPETIIVCLDADGKKARAFIEPLLPAGTPTCIREGGDGAKFFLRLPRGADSSSARLIVPGCLNSGHDGLEFLGQNKKATIPPSIHPGGATYEWLIPLPDDPASIPYCPKAILELERVQTKIGIGDLAEDLEIRQSGGRTMTVSEWRQWMIESGAKKVSSVHSPIRQDTKPSCFLSLRHGSLRLYDSADGRTYRDGVYSSRDGQKGTTIATDKITLPFGKTIRVNRQYLGEGAGNPFCNHTVANTLMVAVRSAVGTGKTTIVADFIKTKAEMLGRTPKVLVLSHRRSLVGHLVRAYQLAADYRDIQDWKQADDSQLNSLAICLDSITSWEGKGKLASRLVGVDMTDLAITPRQWDIVIIDEAESVFRHLHGGTLTDRSYTVFITLGNILRAHTKQVILADAHLSDYSIREYRSMAGDDGSKDVLVLNTWKRGRATHTVNFANSNDRSGSDAFYISRKFDKAPRLVKYATPEDLEATLFRMVEDGKSAYVATTQRGEAVRLTRKFRKLHPTKHVLMISGEHDDPQGEEFLKDPNAYMTTHKVDALIATQAIESGVSIDVCGQAAFDHAFLFAWGDCSTWQDLIQMIGRPRHLRTRVIAAWVEEHGKAPWLNEGGYRRALIEGREATYGLLREHLSPDGQFVRAALDDEHLDSHVRTIVHECRSRRNLAEDFWAYWECEGCEIQDAATSPKIKNGKLDKASRVLLQEEKKADKVAIKVERAEKIASTDTRGMSVADARKVLDRDHSPTEGDRAKKVLVQDFYDREATAELVLTDDGGKLRQQVRRFNAARAVALGDDGIRKVLAAKDEKSAVAGVTATQSHQTIEAIIRWEALTAAGIRPGTLDGLPTTVTTVDLGGWTEYLAKPSTQRAFKLHLKINVQPYLERTRSNVTGVSLIKQKEPPVTSEDGMIHSPVIDSLSDKEFAELGADAKPRPVAQPMRLLQVIAKQMGLKFMHEQIGAGAERGKRTYRLEPASIMRMVDLGSKDWRRLMNTKVNVQDNLESVLDMLAG